MLRFTCPKCRKLMELKEQMAGQKVRCPHCHKVADAPGIPTVLPAEQPSGIVTVLPSEPEPERHPRPERSQRAEAQVADADLKFATALVNNGASPEEVQASLRQRGLDQATAQAVAALAGLAVPLARSKARAEAPSGVALMLKLLGCLLFLVGIGLAIGNRTGLFPTFPFSGLLVMVLGLTSFWAGGKRSIANASETPSKLLGAGKIIGGLALGNCCGLFGVYGVSYIGVLSAFAFGLVMGLGYRWVLTGAANLIGKRVNFFLSVIPVILLLIPALLWGPWLSMEGHAEYGVRKKDAEILREVLRKIEEDHADDPRFADARATARRGLEDLFAEAMEQLKDQKSENPESPADQELRDAFRKLITDLSTRSDGTVYVAFHNEAKLDVPEGDDLELTMKRATADVKEAFPKGDAPVVPAGKAFDGEFNQKRRDTFFKAMNNAFEEVFKQKGLLVLKPLGDNEDRTGKIVFEVKSAAVRKPTYYTYTKDGKVAGLLFSVRADWEFAVIDRSGRELYRKKTSSVPALNISMHSKPSDPAWAPYSVLMDSAYYNYSRDVIEHFGLTPPEQRTKFGFTE